MHRDPSRGARQLRCRAQNGIARAASRARDATGSACRGVDHRPSFVMPLGSLRPVPRLMVREHTVVRADQRQVSVGPLFREKVILRRRHLAYRACPCRGRACGGSAAVGGVTAHLRPEPALRSGTGRRRMRWSVFLISRSLVPVLIFGRLLADSEACCPGSHCSATLAGNRQEYQQVGAARSTIAAEVSHIGVAPPCRRTEGRPWRCGAFTSRQGPAATTGALDCHWRSPLGSGGWWWRGRSAPATRDPRGVAARRRRP